MRPGEPLEEPAPPEIPLESRTEAFPATAYRRGFLPRVNGTGRPGGERRVHMLFSTSCSMYQQWQSNLLFWSHRESGCKGEVTRLVSGCEAEENNFKDMRVSLPGVTAKLSNRTLLRQSTNPNAKVRETPELPESRNIIYSNKPYAVLDWFEHHKDEVLADDVVVIVDPDMLMIRPIPWDFSPPSKFGAAGWPGFPTVHIERGRPVSQEYGLGSAWVKGWHEDFVPYYGLDYQYQNIYNGSDFAEAVCGKGSHCAEVDRAYVEQHLAGGAPMILAAEDVEATVNAWQDFTTNFNKISKGKIFQAEMYTYSMAIAHVDILQTTVDSLMVSLDDSPKEAWQFMGPIAASESLLKKTKAVVPKVSCHDPINSLGAENFPPVMHYCQWHKAHDAAGRLWAFHKGHVPAFIFDCDLPLLKMPPDDLINVQTTTLGRRGALMVCLIKSQINAAIVAHANAFCSAKHVAEKKNGPSRFRILSDYAKAACPSTDPRICGNGLFRLEPADPTIGDANVSSKHFVHN